MVHDENGNAEWKTKWGNKQMNNLNNHNAAYEEALKEAHRRYDKLPITELRRLQETAREMYRLRGATHENTAACVVIHELLNQKGDGNT